MQLVRECIRHKAGCARWGGQPRAAWQNLYGCILHCSFLSPALPWILQVGAVGGSKFGQIEMTRHRIRGRFALLLLVAGTILLLYSASTKPDSGRVWRRRRLASWAYNLSTIRYPHTLLTYGASKDAPEFVAQPDTGARILILAYGR